MKHSPPNHQNENLHYLFCRFVRCMSFHTCKYYIPLTVIFVIPPTKIFCSHPWNNNPRKILLKYLLDVKSSLFFSISNLITFGFQSENLFEMFRNAEKAPQVTLEALVFFFGTQSCPQTCGSWLFIQ